MTPDQITLLEALGVPYVWGAGDLRDGAVSWPDGVAVRASSGIRGYDCSGFAQAALLRLGIVRPGAWQDMRALDLANACDRVWPGDESVGDLAFYGAPVSHVTVILIHRRGHRPVMTIGANGGRHTTLGVDPDACVQVRPLWYRADLVVVGRLKAQWRPA